MKRFALALMLLIGMIGFTGFGNTTPDLAENSTAVFSHEGTENVVNIAYEIGDNSQIHTDVGKTKTGLTVPFKKAEIALDQMSEIKTDRILSIVLAPMKVPI